MRTEEMREGDSQVQGSNRDVKMWQDVIISENRLEALHASTEINMHSFKKELKDYF